jgi:hypothetical protein
MNREQNFLIRYALHNFVTYSPNHEKHIFYIDSTESQSMIEHAKDLIEWSFGEIADIQIA